MLAANDELCLHAPGLFNNRRHHLYGLEPLDRIKSLKQLADQRHGHYQDMIFPRQKLRDPARAYRGPRAYSPLWKILQTRKNGGTIASCTSLIRGILAYHRTEPLHLQPTNNAPAKVSNPPRHSIIAPSGRFQPFRTRRMDTGSLRYDGLRSRFVTIRFTDKRGSWPTEPQSDYDPPR